MLSFAIPSIRDEHGRQSRAQAADFSFRKRIYAAHSPAPEVWIPMAPSNAPTEQQDHGVELHPEFGQSIAGVCFWQMTRAPGAPVWATISSPPTVIVQVAVNPGCGVAAT